MVRASQREQTRPTRAARAPPRRARLRAEPNPFRAVPRAAVEAGRRELGGSEVQWTIWSSAGDAAFEGPSTASDLFHADYADGVFDFSHSFRDTVKALGAQQVRASPPSFTPPLPAGGDAAR